MEIRDLSKDEKIALVGLLERLMMADHVVSAEESTQFGNVVGEIGEDEYRTLVHNYKIIFSDLDKFKQFLQSIERQESRELIYGTLFQIAEVDFFDENESEILDWLVNEWNLDINFDTDDLNI